MYIFRWDELRNPSVPGSSALSLSPWMACNAVKMSWAWIWPRKKSRQHPDFPGGHPPEYYPSLKLLNFTERTGYGVLSLRWPSTTTHNNTFQPLHTRHCHNSTQTHTNIKYHKTSQIQIQIQIHQHHDTLAINSVLLLISSSHHNDYTDHSILPSHTPTTCTVVHVPFECVSYCCRWRSTKVLHSTSVLYM